MAIARGVEHVIRKQNGADWLAQDLCPEPGSASFEGIRLAALRRSDMPTQFQSRLS